MKRHSYSAICRVYVCVVFIEAKFIDYDGIKIVDLMLTSKAYNVTNSFFFEKV